MSRAGERYGSPVGRSEKMMMNRVLCLVLAFATVQMCGATEYRSSIASVRVPDDWRQLPSGSDDAMVFGPASGKQQLVVSSKIERQRRSARDQASALSDAMRSAIMSYQRLYGDDLRFDDSFSAMVEEQGAHVAAIGYASRSGIRVALQIERRGDQQRTVAAYDASGKSEDEFRIWSTVLIEGVR